MTPSETPSEMSPVRLRRGLGVVLALQWNLPLLLMIRYPWPVVHLVMIVNCFVWAGGIYLMGHSPWWRSLIFLPADTGVPPRWRAAAVWMFFLGALNLLGWYFEFVVLGRS